MIKNTILLVLVLVGPMQVLADSPKPIHAWHCDKLENGLLLDAGESYVDLQLVGNAGLVEGRFGQAVQTGGGYVKGAGIGVLPSGAIELWFKQQEAFPNRPWGLIGFQGEFPHDNKSYVLLGMVPGPNKGDPVKFGFGANSNSGAWHGIHIESPPSVGVWHHIVVNWGSKGMQLFVDGRLLAENRKLCLGIPVHPAIFLGANANGQTSRTLIDEVRVYSVSLSSGIVSRHYSDTSYVYMVPSPAKRVVDAGAAEGASLNAADFMSEKSFTSGIQEAIDALPRGGGEVYVPPGLYPLLRSIVLRDNVTLRGAGGATILRRLPEVSTKLVAKGESGEIQVQVEDSSIFKVGQAVNVYDDQNFAWLATSTIIVHIDGNTLTLQRGLWDTYDLARNAAVNNFFPVITAKHARNVTIQNLTIDGGADKKNEGFSDFACSAIHLCACTDSRIEGCQVLNYPSDGISVQGGSRIVVKNNTVINCRERGMHPGTGLSDSIWSGNISRFNKIDGFYFCMNNRHVIVSDNIFSDNGAHGIGGLGHGGDKFNVVANNVCARNGECGIQVFDGSDNIVTGNLCLDNSQAKAGRRAGIEVFRTTNTIVSNNRCLDDQKEKTQLIGIDERVLSDFNNFVGNLCRGSVTAGLRVTGPNSVQEGNLQ